MNKYLISILIILLTFNTFVIADSIARSSISSAGDPYAKMASSEGNDIKILGIDSTKFPKIKVTLFVDEFCAMDGSLEKENFVIEEDDKEKAIENLYFSGDASGQQLDLAIVFDETTSMEAEINSLKLKVRDLTQKIDSSKLDTRYSLVTFNGSSIATRIDWTNDTKVFKNIVELTVSVRWKFKVARKLIRRNRKSIVFWIQTRCSESCYSSNG